MRLLFATVLGVFAEVLRSLGGLLQWPGRLVSLLGLWVMLVSEYVSGVEGPLRRNFRGTEWVRRSRQYRKRMGRS